MNLKEHYKVRLNNLLREEKARRKSPQEQSDSALGELEGLLSNAHDKMQKDKDPRLAAQHKKLADHFMDAYNHHMVGEYDKAVEVALRGIASHKQR